MSIRVALHHRTTYRYDQWVTLSPHVIRLRPAPHCRTPVLSYSLRVTPAEQFLNWQQDPHGNFLARLVFPKPSNQLSVEVDLVADMTVVNPFDFFLEPEATQFPFQYRADLLPDLQPYLRCDPPGPLLQQLLHDAPQRSQGTVDYLVALNQYLHRLIRYIIRMEPGVQSCEETLALRSGSCRDSAWLLVQLLRQRGLAARFVSGYLIQLKPDVKPLDGPGGVDEDFTDLHAWTEVFLPGAGWVGLDPTSGLLAGEGHLPLAATPEPSDAAPIAGAIDECKVDFQVQMRVTRVRELPRVTKPYTEEQWQKIQQLGERVDAALEQSGVHLTMGGEPTFVSADDVDGAQWQTEALGEDKRRLAGILFRRLAKRFAVGPLLHFGQGKWYPGESLPRWALSCYWRKDGEPIWRNCDLIAADTDVNEYGPEDARKFITSLSRRLGVSSEFIEAGYEDAWYYMWKERRLPINVDPINSNLADEEERARLAKVFERGLGTVCGYALPLKPRHGDPAVRWQSGPWFLRSERLFLLPGDSPLGLRLPLDSIPWMAESDHVHIPERDPFADFPPLESRFEIHRNGQAAMARGRDGVFQRSRPVGIADGGPADLSAPTTSATLAELWDSEFAPTDDPANPPAVGESAKWLVRTALCVEARQGILHVFLPPLPYLEDYLELVTAIEDTAAELRMRVRLEGYLPPYDPRLQHFKVTPDPGVIEVNAQPCANWNELVQVTTTLYDEAWAARLRTEKFLLDGRHTGTGGGNHLVLGGATPAASPFLRRPDLLRSLVAYWNNRPSLSYLFSGLFVGPTSQAPRVDEARHESLYELEIAFSQLSKNGSVPSWLVDRVFRHLLVDLTGNTHRAEFCIDKLFSPDSTSGRLGLVEFRAFEMPPHPRMSLVQQLLLRTLIARFWEHPYRFAPIRWGTMLHDRFLLPHFLAQDFQEVLRETEDAGYALESSWFEPHLEFRCPSIGEVTYDGVQMELRQAIEPWHVLGEQATTAGTSRFVDSSLERIQIKIRGLTNPRYVVTCNSRRVPLHPTGVPGEFVAGVRYRAWQPPNCLHPTIGVHSPLVFDLFDTWNSRSIGGCTWHVAHPGGRSFERFPVNAYEAESRRTNRFQAWGHLGGIWQTPVVEHNPDYPLTLDLRRPVQPAALAAGTLG